MKRFWSILFLVIFLTEQSLMALRIPGAITSTTIESSPVQMAAGQPQLYCGQDQRGLVGCWNKDKYQEWARRNGKLEDYRSSQNEGNGLTDYQRQHLTLPGPGPASHASSPRQIPLQEKTTLYDSATGVSFVLDLNSSSGSQLRAEAEAMAVGVVSTYMDFQQRSEHYAQVQKMYQNFYDRAAQQNAAIVSQIRNQADQIGAAADAQKGIVFPNLAMGLASLPMNQLTPEQWAAFKKAKKLAESSLGHKNFEMNEVARQGLEKEFRKAVVERDYATVFEGAEPLLRGQVDGKLRPFDSGGVINRDGVVHIGKLTQGKFSGPFDERSWLTPKEQTEGEVVRRLANAYQRIFVESNGLRVLKSDEKARFAMGQMALGLGDLNLSRGYYERGSSFLAMAETMAASLSGMVYGAGKGLYELAKSIPEMAVLVKEGAELWWNDPVNSWRALASFAQSLPEVAGIVQVHLAQKYQEFQEGSDFFRGKMVGRAIFDVVMTLGPLGEMKVIQSIGTVEKFGAVVSKTVPTGIRSVAQEETILGAMAQEARPLVKVLEETPAVAREGLVRYARNSPEVAVELAQIHSEALVKGEVAISQFIETMMATGAGGAVDSAGRNLQDLRAAVTLLSKNNIPVVNRREVLEAFTPQSKVVKLTGDLPVYRYWTEGFSQPRGRWLTPKLLENPQVDLALPNGGPYRVQKWTIPTGTEIIWGLAAPNFGKPGGSVQIFIPNPGVLK